MMGRCLHYLIFTGWLAFISGPLVAAEAAEGFAIGAGDVVSITVYEHPDLELRTRVSGSGKINYPLLGVVEVIGLTERMLEGLIPVTFLMAMPPGLIMTTLQAISPNELRGQMVAFYLISVSFLSYTFAPSLPAVVSDYFFQSELALGKRISLLAVINYTVAILCLALCLKPYRAALAQRGLS